MITLPTPSLSFVLRGSYVLTRRYGGVTSTPAAWPPSPSLNPSAVDVCILCRSVRVAYLCVNCQLCNYGIGSFQHQVCWPGDRQRETV